MHAHNSFFNSAMKICSIWSLLHTIWTICTSYHLTTCQWFYSNVLKNVVWIIHINTQKKCLKFFSVIHSPSIYQFIVQIFKSLFFAWKCFFFRERSWCQILLRAKIFYLKAWFLCSFYFPALYKFVKCPLSLLLSQHLTTPLPFYLQTFMTIHSCLVAAVNVGHLESTYITKH